MLEFSDSVVDSPHEDGEERIVTSEQLPLRVFDFKSFSFCLRKALHQWSLVHVGYCLSWSSDDTLKY